MQIPILNIALSDTPKTASRAILRKLHRRQCKCFSKDI